MAKSSCGGMQLPYESSLFLTFISSNDACDLLSALEKQHRVHFEFSNGSVFVKGMHLGNAAAITSSLVDAWKRDDFQRSLRISELTDASDCQVFFRVTAAEAALLQKNSKKILRYPGLLHFMSDELGWICLFVKGASAAEVFHFVVKTITPPKFASYNENVKSLYGGLEGPCMLSLWLPDRRLRTAFLQIRYPLEELQRSYSCFVDSRFRDRNENGHIPVDIFAKDLESVLNAKKALLELLDVEEKLPASEMLLRRSGHLPRLIENSDTELSVCESVLSTVEKVRLMFGVRCEEAPRLIGSRGANKVRIEEVIKCNILLRPESKQSGWFPVEVVGRTVEDCERARVQIEKFLLDQPCSLTHCFSSQSPFKQSLDVSQSSSKSFLRSPGKSVVGSTQYRQKIFLNRASQQKVKTEERF